MRNSALASPLVSIPWTNTQTVFVPPPSTPRIRSPGFTIVIVGQAHRLPRVFLWLAMEREQAMRLPYKCAAVAEISRARIVQDSHGRKGSREANRAAARRNPQARPALLRRSRSDNQRPGIRPTLQRSGRFGVAVPTSRHALFAHPARRRETAQGIRAGLASHPDAQPRQ